jgi:diguanylate cyclase (GGDEF)-like protein
LFWNYYQNRHLLKQLKIQKGVAIILSGFFMMAFLYFIDILTMHLLPRFIPMKKAMEIMKDLHLNYNWILSATGFLLLFIGIIYLNKIIFPRIILYQKELEISSITDELTGLLNRRGLLYFAQKQCDIASRNNFNLYFLFVDVDGLKAINDNHGHEEGDKALKATSNILNETFRSSDVISRIGGDEFVVLAIEYPEITIDQITGRLKTNLNTYNTKAEKHYKLSLSMGLIPYVSGEPCDLDKLLSKADKLMYEQKKKR